MLHREHDVLLPVGEQPGHEVDEVVAMVAEMQAALGRIRDVVELEMPGEPLAPIGLQLAVAGLHSV